MIALSKVTKVSASYGVTRGTGVRFEFIRLDMGAEADVLETEDPQVVRRKLLVDLKRDVDEAGKRILAAMD